MSQVGQSHEGYGQASGGYVMSIKAESKLVLVHNRRLYLHQEKGIDQSPNFPLDLRSYIFQFEVPLVLKHSKNCRGLNGYGYGSGCPENVNFISVMI